MRVLGINESGELVFNNSNKYMSPVEFYDGERDYYYITIPHNTAYLPVTATTPSELKLVDYNTGITPIVIESDANISNDIYTINGIKIRENATSVEGLRVRLPALASASSCSANFLKASTFLRTRNMWYNKGLIYQLNKEGES